jgi:hypothetical protein
MRGYTITTVILLAFAAVMLTMAGHTLYQTWRAEACVGYTGGQR